MITIDLGMIEYYNDKTKQFSYENGGIVRFEYSLKAMYEWEGRWRKPFLKGNLSRDELIDFYMTMALDPIDKKFITDDVVIILSEYLKDSQTATTFTTTIDGQNGNKVQNKGKIRTAEEIYALMFAANIPLEFENRNINRLLTVLKIIDIANEPPKKMSKHDILRQNSQLNAARRKKLQTKG